MMLTVMYTRQICRIISVKSTDVCCQHHSQVKLINQLILPRIKGFALPTWEVRQRWGLTPPFLATQTLLSNPNLQKKNVKNKGFAKWYSHGELGSSIFMNWESRTPNKGWDLLNDATTNSQFSNSNGYAYIIMSWFYLHMQLDRW